MRLYQSPCRLCGLTDLCGCDDFLEKKDVTPQGALTHTFAHLCLCAFMQCSCERSISSALLEWFYSSLKMLVTGTLQVPFFSLSLIVVSPLWGDEYEVYSTCCVVILIKYKTGQMVATFLVCVFQFVSSSTWWWMLWIRGEALSSGVMFLITSSSIWCQAKLKPQPGDFRVRSKYPPWSRDSVKSSKSSCKWLVFRGCCQSPP